MRWHKHGMEARQVNADDYDQLCSIVEWANGKPVDDNDTIIELSTADGDVVPVRHGDWVIRARDGQFHLYRHPEWRPLVDGWPLLQPW